MFTGSGIQGYSVWWEALLSSWLWKHACSCGMNEMLMRQIYSGQVISNDFKVLYPTLSDYDVRYYCLSISKGKRPSFFTPRLCFLQVCSTTSNILLLGEVSKHDHTFYWFWWIFSLIPFHPTFSLCVIEAERAWTVWSKKQFPLWILFNGFTDPMFSNCEWQWMLGKDDGHLGGSTRKIDNTSVIVIIITATSVTGVVNTMVGGG